MDVGAAAPLNSSSDENGVPAMVLDRTAGINVTLLTGAPVLLRTRKVAMRKRCPPVERVPSVKVVVDTLSNTSPLVTGFIASPAPCGTATARLAEGPSAEPLAPVMVTW